ncbi:MAG TPA: hypothetical protein ENG48_12790 [Candidatus Atribacteria bacterium]|nr:hypothetical protein [Candidatus Atribacteria bacterium]
MKTKIIGVYGVSNTLAIEIYEIVQDIDDYVIYKGNTEKKKHKAKIYTNTRGMYFNTFRGRIYLSECERV